jgi:hypothetical protein
VRLTALMLAFLLCVPAAAQEAPAKKKPVAKKQAAVKKTKAHQKPTAEQIRKYNELQKKQ